MTNYLRIVLFTTGVSGVALAQPVAVPSPMRPATAYPAPAPVQAAPVLRSAAELDQLLSPIALYPDELVGIMLPAATQPTELSTAASLAASGAAAQQIDAQPWDDSVKALASYPDITAWMSENTAWTEELGMAFQYQPADVMNSIQRLRTEARSNGVLVNTPQQRVVTQNNYISIVPVQADALYVPYYDPQIIRTRAPRGTVAVRFGQPLHVGVGVAFGLDWRNRNVWIDRSSRAVRPNERVIVRNAPVQREVWRARGPVVTTAPVRVRAPHGEMPHPTLFSERRTPTGRPTPPPPQARKVDPRRDHDGRDDDGRDRR